MENKVESEQEKHKNYFKYIAESNGITNSDLFVEFMIRRFPNEKHEPYICEWVGRFLTGNPLPFMDSGSQICFLKAVTHLVSKNVKGVQDYGKTI